MKTYNKKLRESTKKLSKKTYQNAMDFAHKSTNPSPQVLKFGAIISSGIGLLFLIVSIVCLILQKEMIALGIFITGTIIILVNYKNLVRK